MEELKSLVLRAQAGDLEAYGEVVRRFQDMAYGYAYSVVGDFHLAEDAAQEAFIEAYRCLANLREPAAFPGWFRRIAFKHCDRITRQRRLEEGAAEELADTPSEEPAPSEVAERREMKDTVLHAIRSLPEDQRTATTLFYINGYSHEQIAGFLEVTVATVKDRLHASRKRLRERMLTMVAETLGERSLPADFTRDTLQKAIERAHELNVQRKWAEAEEVLRAVLKKAPDEPDVLKELNRALQGTWLFLKHRHDVGAEMVEHGRALLASAKEDEALYRNIADTLLWMPNIPKAIEFLDGWIAKKGPTLDSLGRLAWAKGCAGRYDQAESTWQEFMALAEGATGEALGPVGRTTGALVDCLASAGETSQAQSVLQRGWDFVRNLEPLAENKSVVFLLRLFQQAGLRAEAARIGRDWFSALQGAPERDVRTQGATLMARVWFDDAETVTQDWLAWFRECLARRDSSKQDLQRAAAVMMLAFASVGKLEERRRLGLSMADILKEAGGDELRGLGEWVHVTALAPEVYLDAGDVEGAERVAREAIAAGHEEEVGYLHEIAIIRGQPSPADLMELIAEKGAEGVPPRLRPWYHVAREAAAGGDERKAFAALRRAFEGWWYVKPLVQLERWENDARWGRLREHPEAKRIFKKERQSIGPIHGELKYSPNW